MATLTCILKGIRVYFCIPESEPDIRYGETGGGREEQRENLQGSCTGPVHTGRKNHTGNRERLINYHQQSLACLTSSVDAG